MTRPVLTSVLATENNLVDQEMCFWLGTPWENKEAPQPIDKSVTIQEKPSMIFYASTFNGQMLSHQDWESKYNILKAFYWLMIPLQQTQIFGIISAMILL